MHRKPKPRDDALEELISERDHVRIQISLLRDSHAQSDDDLKSLRDKLRELDAMIESRQRMTQGQTVWLSVSSGFIGRH